MTETKKSTRTGGMAGLAASLSGRADALARRSTQEDLAPEPVRPPLTVAPEPHPEPRPIETQEVTAVADLRETPSARVPEAVSPTAPAASNEPSKPVAPRPRRKQTAAPRPRPLAGPDGRLEASGEPVVKWTLELAPQLVMALNVWERDETRRLGQRVFRERLIDIALDAIPADVEQVVAIVGDLPTVLRSAAPDQFGTRVRASVKEKLLNLRPELRVAGVKNIRTRDVYSAAVYRYLLELEVPISVQ